MLKKKRESQKVDIGALSRELGSMPQHQVSISLRNRGLKEIPLGLLVHKDTLEVLSLSQNDAPNITNVCDLQKLKRLDISHCGYKTIDSNVFVLRNLQSLDVSHNECTEINILVSNLHFLTELNYSNNQITSVTEWINHAVSLEVLNLSNNKIESIPSEMCTLTKITKLYLSGNKIKVIPNEISLLQSLVLLDLSNNNIKTIPANIGKLPALTKLFLGYNELIEVCPELGSVTTLKELILTSNNLASLPNSIGKLENLTLLDLSKNRWCSEEYTTIKDVKALLAFLRGKSTKVVKIDERVLKSKEDRINEGLREAAEAAKMVKKSEPSAGTKTDLIDPISQNFLLKVCGKKENIVVARIDPVYLNMTKKDTFIYVTKDLLFAWLSIHSPQYKKEKALYLAETLKLEYNASLEVIDRCRQDERGEKEKAEKFWSVFGEKGHIPQEGPKTDAQMSEEYKSYKLRIFTDNNDRVDIKTVSGNDIDKTKLSSGSCAILDNTRDVYIWKGTYSTPNCQSYSHLMAEQLIKTGKRPKCATIFMELDEGESTLFKEHFPDWRENVKSVEEREKEMLLNEQRKKQDLETLEEMKALSRKPQEKVLDDSFLDILRKDPTTNLKDAKVVGKAQNLYQSPIRSTRESAKASAAPPSRPPPSLKMETKKRVPPTAPPPSRPPPSLSSPKTPSSLKPPPARPPPSIGSDSESSDEEYEEEEEEEEEEEIVPQKVKEVERKSDVSKTAIVAKGSVSTKSVEKKSASEVKKDDKKASTKDKSDKKDDKKHSSKDKSDKKTIVEAKVDKKATSEIKEEKKSSKDDKKEKKSSSEIKDDKKASAKDKTDKKQATKDKEEKKVAVEVKVEKKTSKEDKPKPIAEPKAEEPKQDESADSKTSKSDKAAIERAKKPKKRLPTKNPLRDRKEKEAATLADEANKEKPVEASKASGMLGGYGILYSVKADEFLFSKRKEKVDGTVKALENTNLIPKDLPKLYMIKGRRHPFARQVELSWRSLNSNDCYVLDTGKFGKFVYQWNGKEANRMKKGKAMDLAKNLRDKERFNAKVSIVDQGKETDDFWSVFPDRPGPSDKLPGKEESGDDEEAEKSYSNYVTLYKAKYVEGAEDLELERVGEEGRPLVKSMLFEGNCYILDCVSEVYAWTSMKAPSAYRKATLKKANDIYTDRSSQFWISPVYHEWAGSEQIMFRERFYDWNSVPISVQAPPPRPKTTAAGQTSAQAIEKVRYDVASMFAQKAEKEDLVIDDGNGGVKIFLVEEFKRVSIPQEGFGEFYSGDSYIIVYAYVWKNKDCHVIYYWQGKHSTIINKGSSAALTIELDDTMKKDACMSKEIRVVQGKEPKHFHKIFQNRFIVHNGRDPRGSSKAAQEAAKEAEKTTGREARMYQIQGEDITSTCAVQTTLSAHYLNSWNTFIVVCPGEKAYVWLGAGSSEREREYPRIIMPAIANGFKCKKVYEVKEGSESEMFWKAIGGKKEYPTRTFTARYTPRLFQCSVSTGVFAVEEILKYSQDDLDHGDAVILDAYFNVFVWIGARSHPAERRLALQTALDYVEYAVGVDKRPKDTPVLRVLDGKEPMIFSAYFHGWDMRPVKKGLKVEVQTYDGETMPAAAVLEEYTRKYSYDDILNKRYPSGIDESRLETYLEDEEFEKLFGMKMSEFERLPVWQKQNLKKKLKLF